MSQFGATPAEWAHFDLVLGLTEDLLPVVSNPAAIVSPHSTLKALGKTPSWYNAAGHATGLARWTERRSTGANIEVWSAQADYGICLQTRRVRALDIDVDDADEACNIVVAFLEELGLDVLGLPCRGRSGSAKRLLAFTLEGDFAKRSFKTERGLVEFLATGQQFVAVGTHPKGQRYEWEGGLPSEFPTISAERFEAAWAALVAVFAVGDAYAGGDRRKGEHDLAAASGDERAAWLADAGHALGEGRDGQVFIACPWKAGHSMDSGPTETAYFPAGTSGYEQGHYKCLHASCATRSDAEFDDALGYRLAGFDVLPETPFMASSGMDGMDGAEPRRGAIVLDPKDLMLVASAALRAIWRRSGGETLVRSCGLWYEWAGTHYVERSEEEIRSDLWRFISTCHKLGKEGAIERFNPGRDYIGNVADALRATVERRGAVPPAWIGAATGPDPADLVSLTDGVLHIPTRELLPHTPGLFVLNSLPFAWGNGNGSPTEWLRFLDQLWPGDTEAQETLQEIMGYLLTPDTSQQKMFMLIGPRRSGKGTIGRILSAMVGQHNLAAPTMHSLTTQFGLQPLIGKLVAVMPDARVAGPGSQAIVEKLLMLSGEDSITIDRKNLTAWTGRPTARVMVLTNEPPRLGDASGALPGRFIVLSLYTSFYGREDPSLTGRLLAELPAIFRWALDGRARLAKRGHFIQPESGLDDADDMAELGSPVAGFVEDCCDLGAEHVEHTDALFEAWREWCHQSGHHPGSKETFGRALKVAFAGVRKVRRREDGRKASYTGVRLKDRVREKLLIGGETVR